MVTLGRGFKESGVLLLFVVRMSFGGLRMLKSPKLTQCYPFASVILRKNGNQAKLIGALILDLDYYACLVLAILDVLFLSPQLGSINCPFSFQDK